MSRRQFVIPLIVIVALAAAAAGWYLRPGNGNGAVVLYGNVDIREAELAFRQPGRMDALYVDEGDTVTAGTLLAELDATPYAAALALAQANRAQAEANVSKLTRGFRTQEVSQAEAAVRQAKAALEEAELTLNRQIDLAKTGSTSRSALDQARSGRDQARAALDSARQNLALLREGYRSEDIAAAQAALAAADAQLTLAQSNLDDTRLLAPADGLISARLREAGSMVNASTPVFTLTLQDPVYIRAYVSEPQLAKVQPGSAVTITIDGSDRQFDGSVGFISPRAEFTPKSVETTDLRTDLVYRVRILVPGAADALRQGMPVTVHINGGS